VNRSKAGRRYGGQDAAAALQECARELNRIPSRNAYLFWRAAAERRRRNKRGYPSASTIDQFYAERGGWLAALEDAGLVAPRTTTVRVFVRSKDEAAELAAVARAAGLIATHAGNRKWLEMRGTLAEVKREMIDRTPTLAAATVTLWEPRTRTLGTRRSTRSIAPRQGESTLQRPTELEAFSEIRATHLGEADT
jgi:hypothetical protein